MAELVRALALGKRVGGSFQVDFLEVSRYYVCSGADAAKYCLEPGASLETFA